MSISMTHDYKHRTATKSHQQDKGPLLAAWLVASLFIGLVMVVGWQYLSHRTTPKAEKIATHRKEAPKEPVPEEVTSKFEFADVLRKEEVKLPPPEVDKKPTIHAPHTEKEYPPPVVATTKPAPTTATTPEPEAKKPAVNTATQEIRKLLPPVQPKMVEQYVLQAGSFRTFSDADKVKARLALLNIQATIQTFAPTRKDTVYRVRIGPLGLDEANQLKNRLRTERIAAVVVKISD